MAYRILLFLLISIAHFPASAQSEAVFEVKAVKTDTAVWGKYKSVVLPEYIPGSKNYLYLDSAFGMGDTIKFKNPKIVLKEAFLQMVNQADVKQHKLKSNVMDDGGSFILRYAKLKKQIPTLIIYSIYSNGSIRNKEWFVYEIKFLP